MNSRIFRFLFFLSLLNISLIKTSRGQSYGLGFLSHDVEAEKRTSLDLFPGKGFLAEDNFRLSFELAFFPNKVDYFGYIFRIENGQKNIDFVYSKRGFLPDASDPYHFKLVNDDQPSKISFNIDEHQIQNQWNKIELAFDFKKDELVLHVNNNKYVESNAHLNKKSIYKFIWGINEKNNDCPPMKIRNIQIAILDKPKYFWPLNEINGDIVHEIINNQNASVSNPLWIRGLHRNWTFQKTLHINGKASIAFNEKDAKLYIVGDDSLLSYNVNISKLISIPYSTGRLNLPLSNQSIYNNYNHKLYNYYIDRNLKQVSTFDFKLKKWNKDYVHKSIIVDYQHSNSFFSVFDTSLYIIGGYGHFIYKNTINHYNINNGRYDELKPKGDYYWPRYLAASGITDSGRTAYFLGGYGSYTGQQILNPKNLYDLMKFDVKTRTFKKVYDLKIPAEDFTLANKMVIDQKSKTFNALIFSNRHYNANLQLIIGHLDSPSYQIVGNPIPYKFHDVDSFATLYYSSSSQQFIAVTLLMSPDNQTTVNIYTLLNPPDTPPENSYLLSKALTNYTLIFWLTLVAIGGVTATIIYRTKKNQLVKQQTYIDDASVDLINEPNIAANINHDPTVNNDLTANNAIFLFGDLQLITSENEDILKHFTSLLKELFLIILIYSFRPSRGISPEKLIELLWSDKSEESAKNNRSANLSRLKSLLGQMGNINLSKNTGKWKIDIDYAIIYLDYYQYLQIVTNRNKLTKDKVCKLMEITQRGSFLSNFEYPWLDQIKSDISNEIIDIYLEYINSISVEDNPEFLIKVANSVFNFDSVNEDAMIIKCKALAYLGKHSLAKSTFENFLKEFKRLYGEEFKKDFNMILE